MMSLAPAEEDPGREATTILAAGGDGAKVTDFRVKVAEELVLGVEGRCSEVVSLFSPLRLAEIKRKQKKKI
jgi:hypothetical protein